MVDERRMTRDNLLLFLWVLFLVGWIYTEIVEEIDRRHRWEQVENFMEARGPAAGNRFTAEDGERLQAQIDELRAEIEQN